MRPTLRPPIEPTLARSLPVVPDGGSCPGGCLLEPKFDGFRAIVFRQPGGVYVQSRAGRPLHGYFPDLAGVVADTLPPGVVLDGELVVWDGERTSFARLQQRLSAGRRVTDLARRYPAHLVTFDLLEVPTDGPLLDRPLAERRLLLGRLLAGLPPPLTLCPQTTDRDEALGWLADWSPAGVEGLMVKAAAGRYQPGRRAWGKYRYRTTTEAVVGGYTGALDTLLYGRYDETGRLRYAGRSGPLTPGQRREIAPLLRPTSRHPWPHPLPAAWSGQLPRPEPLPYERVEPTVVAEISVDTAYEWRRWRHLVRHLRVRSEMRPSHLPSRSEDGLPG
ncbi:ATP-dependent DNA ligase [Plantactinospora sp. GCM10030261]|uniref:ATP-dependent DNA ligase n=1 Tax=Plantactinospora sp. GCM10030261 TaxID=3273420 RepID=UPI00360E4E82